NQDRQIRTRGEHSSNGAQSLLATPMATKTGTLTQLHGIDGQWMTNADLRELARQLNQRAIDGQRLEAEAAHPPRHPATPSFFEYPSFDESASFEADPQGWPKSTTEVTHD